MEPTGPILKKTFVTVAIMLGAWVAFMGTVSTAAVLVTSYAVGAPSAEEKAPAASKAGEKASSTPNATGAAGVPHPLPQRI
jgi:hypothetical protein